MFMKHKANQVGTIRIFILGCAATLFCLGSLAYKVHGLDAARRPARASFVAHPGCGCGSYGATSHVDLTSASQRVGDSDVGALSQDSENQTDKDAKLYTLVVTPGEQVPLATNPPLPQGGTY